MNQHMVLSMREFTTAIVGVGDCVLDEAHVLQRMLDGSASVADCVKEARTIERTLTERAKELDSCLGSALLAPVDRIAASKLVGSLWDLGHSLRQVVSSAEIVRPNLTAGTLEPLTHQVASLVEGVRDCLVGLDDAKATVPSVLQLRNPLSEADVQYVSALQALLSNDANGIEMLRQKAVLDCLHVSITKLRHVIESLERIAFAYA